ncbi:hypothetical protein [Stenotrophomonas rhizophila]|uniref:hypothetical protein n=1 Tax=Stenotrophomonas rhizophila TaxID=216778 RepID=UPI0028B0AB05|nr:hypothetical protein [Stenotrophomonas rhizophila]
MTLIIAADVQDHLILAGDHCAVLSRGSNATEHVIIRNYQKIYSWKYGAIAGSGDVVLMVVFLRLFLLHERQNARVDVLQIASEAKAARIHAGSPPGECVGNIFFTLPASDGFQMHGVYTGEHRIRLETVDPISTCFSMQEQRSPDRTACNAFNGRLRPALFFSDTRAFDTHHLDLLRRFFECQSAMDDRVTCSFDVMFLDKRTGIGRFWTAPDGMGLRVSLGGELESAGEGPAPNEKGRNPCCSGIPAFRMPCRAE